MGSWDDVWIVLWEELEQWLKEFVQLLPNIVVAVIVFCFFLFLAWSVRRLVTRGLNRVSGNQAVNGILSVGVYCFILALGVFVSLGVLKLDKTVTSLLAGAGVIGIALGFAFQEIASNFIAGIFIAFMKPFQVGDVVAIDPHLGTIKRIDIRTTSLVTPEDLEVLIPNKEMFTKTLTNYTTTPRRRLEIKIGVGYNSDLEKVKEITRRCMESLVYRLPDQDVEILFTDFGDSAILLSAQAWIHYPGDNNFAKSKDEAIIKLKKAYDEAEISIPYPVRTIEFAPPIKA